MSLLPITYLPGGGGRSSFWRPVADRLWRQGAPIVFGYPGFGDAPSDPTLETLSDFYEALLSVVPVRTHLVAQSMGSVLALRAAIEHPERIASLVLCAPSGGVDVRSLGGAEWRASLRAEQPLVPTWFFEDASDFTECLASIRVPTLVISGDADPLSPVSVGAFLADRIPRAILQVVSGGAHSMAYDEPARIAVLLGRFLVDAATPENAGPPSPGENDRDLDGSHRFEDTGDRIQGTAEGDDHERRRRQADGARPCARCR